MIVDPSRRLKALDLLDHDEVKKRRANRELGHPAAAPEEADDMELLATIKPPKSKFEVAQLSEKLSAMSAQVATARSDKTDVGQPVPPRGAALKSNLGSLSEDKGFGGPAAVAPVDSQLPQSRFGAGGGGAPSMVPSAAAVRPPTNLEQAKEQALPPGWKKVRNNFLYSLDVVLVHEPTLLLIGCQPVAAWCVLVSQLTHWRTRG